MRRTRGVLRVVCLPALLCVYLGSAGAETLVEQLVEVREGATARFERAIIVRCPITIVEKALDHPALMGVLWTSFGFTPKYQIVGLDKRTDVHVEDPTGIVGDGWLVSTGPRLRVFLGRGQIDHWAVPMLNEGSVAIEIELAEKKQGTRVDLAVFVKPESWLAGAAVSVFSGVVEKHLGKRVNANVTDVKKILEAIADDAEGVAARLEGEDRSAFEALFLAN